PISQKIHGMEVRTACGSPAGAVGNRLPATEAPVPGAPRRPGARRAAVRVGARNSARANHGLPALLRPGQGRRAAGRPAVAGRRPPDRPRPRVDDPPERLLPSPEVLPMTACCPCSCRHGRAARTVATAETRKKRLTGRNPRQEAAERLPYHFS